MKLSIAGFLATVAMLPLGVKADCDESTLQGRYAVQSVLFNDDRTNWENSDLPFSAFFDFDGAGNVEVRDLWAAYFGDNSSNIAQMDGVEGSGSYTVAPGCSGEINVELTVLLPESSSREDVDVDVVVRFVLGGRGLVAESIKGTLTTAHRDDYNYGDVGTFDAVRSQLGAQ